MYKYQEKTVSELRTAINKLEEMTEEHYRMHIGFRHTNEVENENIPIFLEVNGDSYFTQQNNLDECYGFYSKCILENYDRIEISNQVFLDLNKLIDKIIEDNNTRKNFHEKLNRELEALNKSL
jgi:hypothetical protein